MTIHDSADLHKRVERYEAAVDELRAAHQDIKDVLTAQVLFERWQQVGGELGFSVAQPPNGRPQQGMTVVSHPVPEMADSWAS